MSVVLWHRRLNRRINRMHYIHSVFENLKQAANMWSAVRESTHKKKRLHTLKHNPVHAFSQWCRASNQANYSFTTACRFFSACANKLIWLWWRMPPRFGSDLMPHMGVWLEAISVNRFPPGSGRRALSIFFSFCHPSMLCHVLMECPSPHSHSSCSGAHQIWEIKDSPHPANQDVYVESKCHKRVPQWQSLYYIRDNQTLIIHLCILKERRWHVLLIPNFREVIICFAQSSRTFIDSGATVIQPRFSGDIVPTAILPFWHCFWSNSRSRTVCVFRLWLQKTGWSLHQIHTPSLSTKSTEFDEILAFGFNCSPLGGFGVDLIKMTSKYTHKQPYTRWRNKRKI